MTAPASTRSATRQGEAVGLVPHDDRYWTIQ